MRPSLARSSALLLLAVTAACAPTASRGSTGTRPGPPLAASVALPPVPRVEGPLAPRVQYPPANAAIATRDSNFIFGSVGHGGARLSINGAPVAVLPNGSFLAFLPVPPASAPLYTLIASLGADTVRVDHPVRVPGPAVVLAETGPLLVDSTRVAPRGPRVLPGAESVRVSVRAPTNASVHLQFADRREVPLVNTELAADSRGGGGDPFLWATDVRASDLARDAAIVVRRGADSVRLPLAEVSSVDSLGPRFAMLGVAPSVLPDTDRVVIVRPLVGGTYKWFLLPGTIVETTGRIGDAVRVRLGASLEGWVDEREVRELPRGTAAPRRVAANARITPAKDWVDFVIPLGERPVFSVREDERTLVLTLFGTRANSDIITYAGNDTLVRFIHWEQESDDRARYILHLSQAPYGYLAMWERGAFVLRIRRPPTVDRETPLRGLTIAVNAGHPPAGATGPTGLYEAVPTLAISERLKAMLEARGARVIMVRSSAAPMALAERPLVARRANAHAFVSIHLNALPDGINPFRANGTGTYYFHPHAESLARSVQRGMVRRMGLRDLGVYYDNLSDVRGTWMPMILCEGAFIMIPEHEAALRTSEFQAAYARGVADGLADYFRGLSAR